MLLSYCETIVSSLLYSYIILYYVPTWQIIISNSSRGLSLRRIRNTQDDTRIIRLSTPMVLINKYYIIISVCFQCEFISMQLISIINLYNTRIFTNYYIGRTRCPLVTVMWRIFVVFTFPIFHLKTYGTYRSNGQSIRYNV